MMVPLDRGSCVSLGPFAHLFLKCAPLPHKTMGPQSGSFVVVPFFDTPVDDSAFSPLPTLSSFLGGAQTSDPCRGFGSSPPTRTSACFRPGLQSVTPVEDSALPIQRASSRPQGAPKTLPRRSQDAPRCAQDASGRPVSDTFLFGILCTSGPRGGSGSWAAIFIQIFVIETHHTCGPGAAPAARRPVPIRFLIEVLHKSGPGRLRRPDARAPRLAASTA